jgi:arylformamidase
MSVFLHYDQAALDRQYDQRVWADNAEAVIGRYATASDEVRGELGAPVSFAYGEGPAETFDLYQARSLAEDLARDSVSSPLQPIHIFVHGGAWRTLSKRESAFPAPCFVQAGCHFIALDFALMPAVTLADMVQQIRQAVAWIYRHAEQAFNGDRERIYISGHSSGGHLAACLLTTDWPSYGLPETVIKGGLCASGMYDLEPVRLSSRNTYVKLDTASARDLSPLHHLDHLHCPVIVAYGDGESDEFKRQGSAFAAALAATPYGAGLLVGVGSNHFEIIESLADSNGLLGLAALNQMGFASASIAGSVAAITSITPKIHV